LAPVVLLKIQPKNKEIYQQILTQTGKKEFVKNKHKISDIIALLSFRFQDLSLLICWV